MLERRIKLKTWYTIMLLGFLLFVSLYGILLRGSYIVLQTVPTYRINRANFTYAYQLDTLPVGDYERLIDLNQFYFRIFNDACNDTSLLLLVLIHSSPLNFEKRKLIRDTWGRERDGMKLVFTLGDVKNASLQQKLENENNMYHDFVQGNFNDAYRNMTYKHIMVLKYAIYHCPQAKYILKTDDDIFVNIETLLHFLSNDLSPRGVSNLLLCKIIKNGRVFRSYRSKWRVSVAEYRDRHYPTYCVGFSVLYSPDVLFEIYKRAQEMRYFWIDDVHVTGTAVIGTNISHTDVTQLIMKADDINSNNLQHFLYGDPNMNREDILRIWKFTEDSRRIVK